MSEHPFRSLEHSLPAPEDHDHSGAQETRPDAPGHNSSGSWGDAPRPNAGRRWDPWIAANPRVLIVTGDDRVAEKLALILRHAGLSPERARNMTEGCECARSGRFPVVVTAPQLRDGSWKRLALIARNYRPGFAIILLASNPAPRESAQAIEDGALDVLDALYELPKAAEAAKRALWTEYLTGAWPNFVISGPEKIA